MTGNDYSIKPLPTLPHVPGLKSPANGEERGGQKKSGKQVKERVGNHKNDDSEKNEKQIFIETNENDEGIDFCA